MNALTECYDPEIPVNIVDLGLIYDVRLNPPDTSPDPQDVEIEMTMTSPGLRLLGQVHPRMKSRLYCEPGLTREGKSLPNPY